MQSDHETPVAAAEPYNYMHDVQIARFIVLALGLIALVAVVLMPINWKLQAAAFSVMALILAFYIRAVNTAARERFIDPEDPSENWKLQVQPEVLQVSNEDFWRLRHILVAADGAEGTIRESRIRRVTRQHAVFMWLRVGPLLVLSFLFVVLAVAMATHGSLSISTSVHLGHARHKAIPHDKNHTPVIKPALPKGSPALPSVHLPHAISFAWWLPLLLAIICAFVSWVRWLRWKYGFRMITDWNTYLVTMPPIWLPLWQPKPLRMSYDEMDTSGVRNSFLGNVYGKLVGKGTGWGTVNLDSPANQDKSFNNITGQPDHQRFVSDVEAARRSYKRILSIPGK